MDQLNDHFKGESDSGQLLECKLINRIPDYLRGQSPACAAFPEDCSEDSLPFLLQSPEEDHSTVETVNAM